MSPRGWMRGARGRRRGYSGKWCRAGAQRRRGPRARAKTTTSPAPGKDTQRTSKTTYTPPPKKPGKKSANPTVPALYRRLYLGGLQRQRRDEQPRARHRRPRRPRLPHRGPHTNTASLARVAGQRLGAHQEEERLEGGGGGEGPHHGGKVEVPVRAHNLNGQKPTDKHHRGK